MFKNITIQAGSKALQIIRDEGLKADRIEILAGASGGPKWMVLFGFDRVLPDFFKGRNKELHMIGSSIGTFRFAAMSQKDPLSALLKFRERYICQHYYREPTPAEVTAETRAILDSYINNKTTDESLSHSYMRLNILADKARGLGNTRSKAAGTAHLGLAATFSIFSRKSLGMFFRRTLFSNSSMGKGKIFSDDGIATDEVSLNRDNFIPAILASGSIPLVMEGITGIAGAPEGAYYDGGIIDYHLDLPFRCNDNGIVLYPHFFTHITPGWFDKHIPWRKHNSEYMKHTVLVSPSDDFVRNLPYSKIPDRKDFYAFVNNDNERIKCWNTVADRSIVLADEFMEAVNSGKISDIVRPLN